jgi:cyclase
MKTKAAKATILVLCLCACIASVRAPAAAQGDGTIYGTRQLGPDTYAYVDRSGSNCGFVSCREGVVVIDTGGTSTYAKNLMAAIREHTGKHVRYVINTHYHPESTFGNYLLSQGATIIAHPKCRAALQEKGEEMLHAMRAEGAPDLGGVSIKLPMMIVSKKKELPVFGKKIILIPFAACHSPGDLCVWLPDEKVLFSGDLVFTNYMPDLRDSNIANWIEALDRLAVLEPETIVPAHGLLCDAKAIETDRRFLETLRSQVKAAKEAGTSKEEACQRVDLSEFAGLVGYRELLGVAVSRAYEQTK